MRFTVSLLPLLLNLTLPTGVHVVPVFGPGKGDKNFPTDLVSVSRNSSPHRLISQLIRQPLTPRRVFAVKIYLDSFLVSLERKC